jgi:hypothetical protein
LVSAGRFAAASQIATPSGPIAAEFIEVGTEIWAVGEAGEMRTATVVRLERVSNPESLTQVLTRAGDVLATSSSQLASAQGPVRADDIRPGPRSLELVGPGDLPRAVGNPVPLEGLDGFTFVIPQEIASPGEIERALSRARVSYTLAAEGGWVAVTIDDRHGTASRWTWDDELDVLLALTAWAPEDETPVYRTRIHGRLVRSRLTGVLVACGRRFDLRWVPTYRPVEARVKLTDAVGAFTGVVAVQRMTGEAVDLLVEGATAAVADLTYVRLRRLGA